MTVTMTMEEYLSLHQEAEGYRALVAAARAIIKNERKTIPNMFKSDCYNYTNWASEGNIDAIQQQFGTIEGDA
jgi:hypothetical protein